MTSAIVPGSLASVATQERASLAETFIGAEIVVIADTSGSMGCRDSRGGKSRYEVLKEELAALQAEYPGKLAVVAFSDAVVFVPGGEPPYLCGGTDLAGALQFTKMADVAGVRFVVISDGQPDDEQRALAVARTYQGHISCIYVGPEAYPAGKRFLEQLAAASGGRFATADRVMELATTVRPMLTKGV